MSDVKPYIIVVIAAGLIAFRMWRRRNHGSTRRRPVFGEAWRAKGESWQVNGDVALVAAREVRERTRGRLFRIGTAVILLAVAAAIVIPVLRRGQHSHQRVGVVGALSAPLRDTVTALGPRVDTTVTLVTEPTLAAAEQDLDDGRLNVVIVDARRLIVKTAFGAGNTSTTALLTQAMSSALGLQSGLETSGLAPARAAQLAHAPPLPVTGLHPAHNRTSNTTTVYGLILMFVLLSQYGTWILLGVVEEKSSRVVEVLLAALRPRQLLAGKVLGIGIVALVQAALIVGVALGLGAAVGSDLVRGGATVDVLGSLAWLILGYAFYCWVYAAAGSLGTRQEHIQTLAFPMQLPILLGYITALTALSSGTASTFVQILAYLPPTAPFAMPVLVTLGQATWWQFALSAAISLAATFGVARLAATIYLRAILRTGQRVRLRDVVS